MLSVKSCRGRMGVRVAHFGQTSTGPERGAKKPHPTKQCFRLCISRSLYVRNHGRIGKFACQHKVLASTQCLPMFTFRIQENTNQPRGCLSQGWFSSGCVAAPWPGAGVCHLAMVHPSQWAMRPAGQVSCHYRGSPAWLSTVPQNSTSLWLVYIKSSLTSTPLRQVCGTMEGKRQMKQIYT